MKKNLYIFGCSGIAKSIIDSITRCSDISLGQIYLVDSDKEKSGVQFYRDYPVLHIDDLDSDETSGSYAILAYFKPKDIYSRKAVFEEALKGYRFQRLTVIDPSASVSPSAVVGEGVYIAPHVVIDSQAKIGNDSIVLFNSVISREVVIGSSVFISASVVIKGSVNVGDSTFISAGCLITKDIEGQAFINAGVMVNATVPLDTIIGNKASTITVSLPKDAASAERKLRFFHP